MLVPVDFSFRRNTDFMNGRLKRAGDAFRIMLLKSVRFNLLSMLIGSAYLWVGYNAYLTSRFAEAILGIVGGAVIVLFSTIIIVFKILTG